MLLLLMRMMVMVRVPLPLPLLLSLLQLPVLLPRQLQLLLWLLLRRPLLRRASLHSNKLALKLRWPSMHARCMDDTDTATETGATIKATTTADLTSQQKIIFHPRTSHTCMDDAWMLHVCGRRQLLMLTTHNNNNAFGCMRTIHASMGHGCGCCCCCY